jgi:hypothetical protein
VSVDLSRNFRGFCGELLPELELVVDDDEGEGERKKLSMES